MRVGAVKPGTAPLRTNAAAGSGSGGGISSPLTETDAADRAYHSGEYITTADGLFAWPAISSMSFTDASGRAVVIQFAVPA